MRARQGMEQRASQVWASAGRAHLFTERESVGGRVWPNVNFDDKRIDYAFALWGNSAVGLLCYWWRSTRQPSSKATITIHVAETLPVFDFRTLSDGQIAFAQEVFQDFLTKEFEPAYLADADPNRALLDRRVLCDMLGFDDDVYLGVRRLAAKWCAEPSVHGGKPRPPDARFVA